MDSHVQVVAGVGSVLTKLQKSQKGVTPNQNEWQIDHITRKATAALTASATHKCCRVQRIARSPIELVNKFARCSETFLMNSTEFPVQQLLWPNAIVASIAHAVLVARFPDLSYEQSWDGNTAVRIAGV